MTDNMQRARELLAAEYEKHGRSFTARTILSNPERVGEDFNRALRAIAAALRSAQVPEWRPIETAPKVKVRAYDLLWERAHTVIATFEQLGKTRSVQEQMTLHRQCEAAMVSLKETLDATEETP